VSEIPRQVLSDAFQKQLRGRRVRAALFFTFRFDPGFFEREVLPVFFDVPLSHVPALRLLNLEDALRAVDGISVYYDARGLEAGAESAKLDVQRVPVTVSTGYFHPKNVLLLLDESLIVAALSANLTRAGWWENVEAVQIEEMHAGVPCSFRGDVLKLLRGLRRLTRNGREDPALDCIERFVVSVPQEEQRLRGGTVLPRLFSGGNVVDFLANDLKLGTRLRGCNLEILSPYFDADGAAPLVALCDAFRPGEVRVFLPRGLDGEARCSPEASAAIERLADWASLPGDLLHLSASVDRNLHAKVYRFFRRDDPYEAFFVGSVNLTSAAFQSGGNFESGFFVETESPPKKTLDWWLTVADSPATFQSAEESGDLPRGNGWKLGLRYHWTGETAESYWDGATPSPALTLLAQGSIVGELAPLAPRQWQPLDAAIAARLQQALTGSSFITVRIEGEEDAQILVDEVEMSHKPSLMRTLSTADILQYWALLSPEQRQQFLEERAVELLDDPELARWLGSERPRESADTFSTFARIYISFANLERAVRAALAEGREREAVDRLFGRKFDSLRRLIERIREEAAEDGVRQYVTLLCARQLLDVLAIDEPAFVESRRADLSTLRQLLDGAFTVRDRLQLGSAEERQEFLRWLERRFVRRAAVVEPAP
jgi:hypothetical protein